MDAFGKVVASGAAKKKVAPSRVGNGEGASRTTVTSPAVSSESLRIKPPLCGVPRSDRSALCDTAPSRLPFVDKQGDDDKGPPAARAVIGGGCTVTSRLGEYGADSCSEGAGVPRPSTDAFSETHDGDGPSRGLREVAVGLPPLPPPHVHASAAEATTALRGKGRLLLALMGGGGTGSYAVRAKSTGLAIGKGGKSNEEKQKNTPRNPLNET